MDRSFTNSFLVVMFNCIALLLISSIMGIAPDHVTPAQFFNDWGYFILGTFLIFNVGAFLAIKFGYDPVLVE